MLHEERLWADLFSSMPMCFNQVGEVAADSSLANHAVRTWWPDVPGTMSGVRFEHSRGRHNPEYLGNGAHSMSQSSSKLMKEDRPDCRGRD